MDTDQVDNQAVVATLTAKAREVSDLPEKARAFCVAYVIEGVGSYAALAAGYSEGSRHSMAAHWLRDRRAIALIAELRTMLPDVRPLDPNAIQSRLGMLAMTDVAGMLVPDERYPDADPVIYRWKRPEELTAGERALVQHVMIDEVWESVKGEDGKVTGRVLKGQEFRYKVLSNKDSLDSLARTFGMFRDRVEHEHKHRIDAVFEFIAKSPETSETVARMNRRHGRVIEGEAKEVKSS